MEDLPMNVLITGGAGFLGSHLCDRYLQDGHRVTCVDSLLTGRRQNVAHLERAPGFRYVEADIVEVEDLDPADLILHFASPASPPEYQRYPMETMRVGAFGTWRMLELARRTGARFLLASTSETYGDPLVHPQSESYWGNVNPNGVRSIYDETKRFAETVTCAFHREHAVDTAIVRIFNTYGPRMKMADGRVIPNLVSQALRDEPLTVYGDGRQTRSYCYYADLIEGIVRLAASGRHEPVNLGNPDEFTVLALAEQVRTLTRSTAPIVFKPLPQDDPTRRRPDISRARAWLGWEPRVPLSEGLPATIEHFREELTLVAS